MKDLNNERFQNYVFIVVMNYCLDACRKKIKTEKKYFKSSIIKSHTA